MKIIKLMFRRRQFFAIKNMNSQERGWNCPNGCTCREGLRKTFDDACFAINDVKFCSLIECGNRRFDFSEKSNNNNKSLKKTYFQTLENFLDCYHFLNHPFLLIAKRIFKITLKNDKTSA